MLLTKRHSNRLVGLMVTAAACGCGAIYGPCLEPGATGPPPDGGHVDCVQVYEPVCGCDGRTYGNACLAGVAGVTVIHDGTCGLLDELLLPPCCAFAQR